MAARIRVLLVAAEMAPLIKLGGLGDVLGALPGALRSIGIDARVLLPAYSAAMVAKARLLTWLPNDGGRVLAHPCETHPVYLLDHPGFRSRDGLPYADSQGDPWPTDAVAYAALGKAAAAMADGALPDWRPEVLHCHDWHAGLASVWLRVAGLSTASVFTIHNLAFTGRFERSVLARVGLPAWLDTPDALEFYGDIAFIKGGLVFADRLTTVSPQHAREILTPEGGFGLDGLLRARRTRLTGILNGIDTQVWDPRSDPDLPCPFGPDDLAGKSRARSALLERFGLQAGSDQLRPVLAWVARLTHQKGTDLLLDTLPRLLEDGHLVVVLGSGDATAESALRELSERWPTRLGVYFGFDEKLAHLTYAGADVLLMPSRYEPCGLSQLYAMRYGTLPVATPVGGLADTIFDADDSDIAAGRGNGFLMRDVSAQALLEAVGRANACFAQHSFWERLMCDVMRRDWGWSGGAEAYAEQYELALEDRRNA